MRQMLISVIVDEDLDFYKLELFTTDEKPVSEEFSDKETFRKEVVDVFEGIGEVFASLK
jgi:hypothetical protein